FGYAIRFLREKRWPSNEAGFIERDEKSQTSLEWGRVFIEFMAVERITNFRAQGVACSEPGRLQTERMACCKHVIPERLDQIGQSNHFESILAGVAGSPYVDR